MLKFQLDSPGVPYNSYCVLIMVPSARPESGRLWSISQMCRQNCFKNQIAADTSKAAEAVAPGFDFPFYGHVVSKFYITTHGFLSFAPRSAR